MKYYILIITITTLTYGCISKKAPKRLLNTLNNNNTEVNVTKRCDANFTDTLNWAIYDFNINNTKTYTISFDNNNRLIDIFSYYYPTKRNVGPQFYFHENSTKLDMMYFLDSSFLPQGPWFFYKKNGKLKHLLLLKDGYCEKVIYTVSEKQLKKDTFPMIAFIRGPLKR